MSDAGGFCITIAIENPARRGTLRSIDHVRVDTGSEFTRARAKRLVPAGPIVTAAA